MALPQLKDLPPEEDRTEEYEQIFRPVRDENGELRILQLPATLENLLNPQLEDEVTQTNRHSRTLDPLADALRRHLERTKPGLGIFHDLMLLCKRHGYYDVTPDVAAIEGVEAPETVDESLDFIALGLRLTLAIEVVSTTYKDSRVKDEVHNVDLYDQLGVTDYVMVYPYRPQRGERLRIVAKTRSASGAFVDNLPNRRGHTLLRSVGLRMFVDESRQRLGIIDVKTGERILFSIEEEEARREAESRAEQAESRAEQAESRAEQAESRAAEAEIRTRAEALLDLLDQRSVAVSDEARRRILACREIDRLKLWFRHALAVEHVDDLWDVGP